MCLLVLLTLFFGCWPEHALPFFKLLLSSPFFFLSFLFLFFFSFFGVFLIKKAGLGSTSYTHTDTDTHTHTHDGWRLPLWVSFFYCNIQISCNNAFRHWLCTSP